MRRRSNGGDNRQAAAREGPSGQLMSKSSSSSSKQTSDSRLSTSSSNSSSTGFQSFFRWFKRNEKEDREAKKLKKKNCPTNNEPERIGDPQEAAESHSSQPQLSPRAATAKPRNDVGSSSSSSCDSVFSTATNGFAFISPVNYNPHGPGEIAEIRINPEPETDTYRHRCNAEQRYTSSDHQNNILSLKKKYGLYGTSETLQSENTFPTQPPAGPSSYIRPQEPLPVPPKPFSDLSLPSISHQNVLFRLPVDQQNQSVSQCDLIQNSNSPANIAHRRTWSECSIKKSNKRTHVRGKRPAPAPPGSAGSSASQSSSLNRLGGSSTYSSLARSTLKKRRAPPPPYYPSSASHEVLPLQSRSNRSSGADFLNQIDEAGVSNSNPEMDHIRYFVNQQQPNPTSAQNLAVHESAPKCSSTPDPKCMSKKNVNNLRVDVSIEDVRLSPRLSPISPRPWYKRPVSGSREPTAIPFKREVILRTVDKRRNKKHATEEQQPEMGFMRSSRFAIFSRNKEAKKVETTEEVKRRSGIGMPNISELDREAQQIVSNQRITLTDEVVLRQRDLISDSEEEADGQLTKGNFFRQQHPARRRKSAKELISQFEAKHSQKHRVTSPILADERQFNSEPPTQSITTPPPPSSSSLVAAAAEPSTEVAKNTVIQPDVVKLADENEERCRVSVTPSSSSNKVQLLWKCPYCTLENPNWRILCEVCERIKPYEGKSCAGIIPIGIRAEKSKSSDKLRVDNEILDKKVDKVKQYFLPQNLLANTLTKSASETSLSGNLMTSNKFKKSIIESPNFNEIRCVVHKTSNTELRNEVVVNSVTVIYDPGLVSSMQERKKTNLNGTPDLEEVRHARLNHFKPQPSRDSTVPVMITDKDSLDRERERLKEKIRAMNAKALSERYPEHHNEPVEQTYDTVYPMAVYRAQDEPKRSSPDRSAGAIKKFFNKPEVEKVQSPVTMESTRIDAKEVVVKAPASKLIEEVKNKDVDDLAGQLKSMRGREEFKATLKLSEKTGTIAINKIIKSLEKAIMDGKDEMAAKLAMDLAKMKVSLSVTRQRKEDLNEEDIKDPKIIRINLLLEDDGKVTKAPVEIKINPEWTVSQLKEKIKLDFHHPIEMQKFIYKDTLLNDDQKSLEYYGMNAAADGSSSPLKLFIVGILPLDKNMKVRESSPKKMNSKYYLAEADQFSDDENGPEANDGDEEEGAKALPISRAQSENPYGAIKGGTWTCPLCTLINSLEKLTCGACSKTKPTEFRIPNENKKTPIQLKKFTIIGNNLSRPNTSRAENHSELNIRHFAKKADNKQISSPPPPPPVIVGAAVKLTEDPGFLSKALGNPNITRNRYRGVDNYNPKNFLKGSSPVRCSQIPVKQIKSPKVSAKNPLHLELLKLNNNKDVVENIEAIECPICFSDCQPGNGVVLRDCLHSFCRECVSSTVEHSEEAEIKCPYMDSSYSCDSVLQEREIRAVVTEQIYEKHLMKSIREAENKIENAFHCKTPNCRGWCIYEDNVNMFRCPVCSLTNCLTCQAIHDGLNCKQFQDQMQSDCGTNEDAKRTKEMLERMVKDGEAMNCPTCQVIVMKKWGCDWLKCSMCKTEICWVTRGPRWGPGGKGDISDGCKCGVFGKKCHSKCTYCH